VQSFMRAPLQHRSCVEHSMRCRALRASSAKNYIFNSPVPQERIEIVCKILSESLNPLSLDLTRFVAARDPATGRLVGFGQLKPLAPGKLELSSLVVYPEHRGQGLGTVLVEELLKRALDCKASVYLTTVRDVRAARVYARCGFFEILEEDMGDVPFFLKIEMAVGNPIARNVTGNDLMLMRWDPPL